MILKKKIIILGTSIGPFRSGILRRITSLFLRRTHFISVRDKKSQTTLQDEGVDDRKIQLIPDIAFDLPVDKDGSYDQFFAPSDKTYIGIGVSALASKYIEREKLARFLAKLCDHVVAKYNAKVILIPHVLSQFNDDAFAMYIHSMLNRKESAVVIHESNPMKIKYVISKLDLLVSFRMHPMIHALSVGTPVIGIDYNDKAKELLKLFHMERWVVDITDLDSLPETVDTFFTMKKENGIPPTTKTTDVSKEYISLLEKAAHGIETA